MGIIIAKRIGLILSVSLIILSVSAQSQTSSIAGTWNIDENGYHGTMTINGDSGIISFEGFPEETLTDIAFDGKTVSFIRNSYGGHAADQTYTGELSNGKIEGTFTQANVPGEVWQWTASTVEQQSKGGQAPCAADGEDYAPRPPTDPYIAGPSLVPGSYNIWYCKRTGSNIGNPDAWNKLGPVQLENREFYVFDVPAANLAKAEPQAVNPMLSEPTSGESVVWLKLSDKDPYVVCFEGLLGVGGKQVGFWKMYGHQEGFNDWEAYMHLKADRTLDWEETVGANVGAKRQGTWSFDGKTLILNWVSPDGGQTSWTSRSVTENSIRDGTYTVENAPGGTWFAEKTTSAEATGIPVD